MKNKKVAQKIKDGFHAEKNKDEEGRQIVVQKLKNILFGAMVQMWAEHLQMLEIRNYTGQIVAAVSASIPTFRMNEQKKEFVLKELGQTAEKISRELGYQG